MTTLEKQALTVMSLSAMAIMAAATLATRNAVNLWGDKFNVGDCIRVHSEPEKWEEPRYVSKVTDKGHSNYQLDGRRTMPFSFETVFDKVECE